MFILGIIAYRRNWFAAISVAQGKVWLGMVVLLLMSMALVPLRLVTVKMLPFDNKSELQVVLDMPEGTSVEQTARVLDELSRQIETVPEVTDYQVYAGTAAPIPAGLGAGVYPSQAAAVEAMRGREHQVTADMADAASSGNW